MSLEYTWYILELIFVFYIHVHHFMNYIIDSHNQKTLEDWTGYAYNHIYDFHNQT